MYSFSTRGENRDYTEYYLISFSSQLHTATYISCTSSLDNYVGGGVFLTVNSGMQVLGIEFVGRSGM